LCQAENRRRRAELLLTAQVIGLGHTPEQRRIILNVQAYQPFQRCDGRTMALAMALKDPISSGGAKISSFRSCAKENLRTKVSALVQTNISATDPQRFVRARG
jgi:hypothetical protein